MSIDTIGATFEYPPPAPEGPYRDPSVQFRPKMNALIAWFTTNVEQFSTFVDTLNNFINQANSSIQLIENGIPIDEYTGNANNIFKVKDGNESKDAVNVGQLEAATSSLADSIRSLSLSINTINSTLLKKADKYGNANNIFKVKDGEGSKDAVNVGQLSSFGSISTEGTITLTTVNGWTGAVYARRTKINIGGAKRYFVEIWGSPKNGSGSSSYTKSQISTLPSGYRPSMTARNYCWTTRSGFPVEVSVDTSGRLFSRTVGEWQTEIYLSYISE